MAVYTCCVGGLRSDIDYYHLRKAFSQFDGMIGTKIIYNHAGRSTGYGFVNFSKETSMRDAIRIMNGMILYGHQMTVEEAPSGGIRGRGGGGSGHGGRGGGYRGGRIYHGCSSGGGGRGYSGKDSRSVNGEGRGSNSGGRGRGGSGVAWNVQRQPLQQAPQVMGPIDFYSGPRVVNGFYIEYTLEDEDANFFKFPSPAECARVPEHLNPQAQVLYPLLK